MSEAKPPKADVRQKIMKIFLVLATFIAILAIGEIWFNILDNVLVIKILGTVFVIGGLLAVYMMISESMDENKKMKDDNYLN